MFENDLLLKGKHATYTKFLCSNAKVFKRYLDVYMLGAIMGFLHGRKGKRDTTTKDEASIMAETVIKENNRCKFLYRLIMLLDETTGLTPEQRIDRAFRQDADQEAMNANMALFNSYVLGGIEVLYKKFKDCTTRDDYIDKIYEFIVNFNRDINVSSYDELIEKMLE